MKQFFILFALLLAPAVVTAQVIYPNRGGTGVNTIPSAGQVLVGQSNGTYAPQATSTLGITGGGGGGSTPPGGGNGQLQYNDSGAFGGTSSPVVGHITATRTDATSTLPRLSVTTAFNLLGTIITDVGTWFSGLFDTNFAAKDTDDLTEGGTNLYYTDSRARSAISETVTGLDYTSGTGVLSQTSGYVTPLSASTTQWKAAFDASHSAVTLAGSLDYLTLSGQQITRGAIDLATDITGTLTETRGGTNQTTYATGDILYASSANTLAKRAIGTTGQVLMVTGGVPTWTSTSSLGISGVADGGSNWSLVSGGLRTSTTTDFAQAAYFVGSSTATSTFGGNIKTNNAFISGSPAETNRQGFFSDGNGALSISSALTVAGTGASNILNNFNSFTGLLLRRTSTGSGAFIRALDSTGTEHFNVTAGGSGYFAGNLGVGSSSPSAKLTIDGDMRLTGRFADSASSTGSLGNVLTATANGTQWLATTSLGLSPAFSNSAGLASLLSDETGSGGLAVFSAGPTLTGTTTVGSLVTSGFVGIGTTTPQEELHVVGVGAQLGIYDNNSVATGRGGELLLQHRNNSQNVTNYASIKGGALSGSTGAEVGSLTFNTMQSGVLTEAFRVNGSTGNVGISSTTPGAKLVVSNPLAINSLIVEDQASDPTPFTIAADGKVGINTLNPNTALQIGDGTTVQNNAMITFGYTTTTAQILMPTIHQTSVMIPGTSQDLAIGSRSSFGGLVFYTGNNTSNTNLLGTTAGNDVRMAITYEGNTGIGSTTPRAKFTITHPDALTNPVFIAEDQANDTTPFIITNTGLVGIGTTTPTTTLSVWGGGISVNPGSASKPTCNAQTRGMYWNTFGGAGVKDNVEVCAKDAADAYAWRTIY